MGGNHARVIHVDRISPTRIRFRSRAHWALILFVWLLFLAHAATLIPGHSYSWENMRDAKTHQPPSLPLWLGAGGFLLLVALGSLVTSSTCELDRDLDRLRLVLPGFTGRKTTDYKLSEVIRFKAITHENRDYEQKHLNPVLLSVGARLVDGSEVSLTHLQKPHLNESEEKLLKLLEDFRKGRGTF